MLETADLARYAGQFVWLELNFDAAANQTFFTRYGAVATPTFYIIDPEDGHVVASQTGAMSLAELKRFLDRGASSTFAKAQTEADRALTQGDALLALQPAEAVKAYRQALQAAPAAWEHRELAQASLVIAMQNNGQYQACVETAVTEAAGMRRDVMFGRTVVAGMWCVGSADSAPWSKDASARLEPLAKEALSLPTTIRDHRDELYRTLMYVSLARGDKAQAAQWGDRWLAELDAIKPANDEERSAVDIARVEDIQTFGDPKRILPALLASERAMPGNWNASLRVAQMEIAAGNDDQAIAACDRGLARDPGPAGRSWMLRVKADALNKKGKQEASRRALEEALKSAEEIPNPQTRDHNVNAIRNALQLPASPKQKN